MTWYLIRLELGATPDFPAGSPIRFYLLRLPLTVDGQLDEAALSHNPGRARVRRFWPNEADLAGYVIRADGAWAFSYRSNEGDDERIVPVDASALRLNDIITLTEPDGGTLPFRVADLSRIDHDPLAA